METCRKCSSYCHWNEECGGECLKAHHRVMPDNECVYDRIKRKIK